MVSFFRLGWVPSLVFLMMGVAAARANGPTRTEIAKMGKTATALVESKFGISRKAQGSAFCIHPSGFFITNEHVVRQEGSVSVVLNPGLKTQKVMPARVVRLDKELDLALLQVTAEKDLPALVLGADDKLAELAEVVAFGFPFGTALAQGKNEYPAISVNVGSVTSLRLKGGELHRIQLDAVLNPGNSGGPLLDKDGKVVGVVVGGVPGAGVNFAIPVRHVAKFVARPEIVFEPPALQLAQVHAPVEFQARTVSLLPAGKPMGLELHLFVDEKKSRKLKMEIKDGIHRVTASPVIKPEGPAVLRLTAVFDHGTVSGQINDGVFQVAGADIKLSEVRRLLGLKSRVVLHEGKVLRGKLANLETAVRLGQQDVRLDLSKSREVRFEPPGGLAGLGCTLVAFQDDKEIGRVTRALPIQGLPQPDEDSADLDIEVAPLAKDVETRGLPAPIGDLAVGGGGRYLILHLPKISKLAIFDVNEAKIVRMLPAPEDNLKFTAGLDKLFVAQPGSGTLQRWSLTTFAEASAVPLPKGCELLGLAMGAASQGPVLMCVKEEKVAFTQFHLGFGTKVIQLSPDKLEQRDILFIKKNHPPHVGANVHFRASPDGTALGMWCAGQTPSGVTWMRWENQIGELAYHHASYGHVLPAARGKILYTGQGMYTSIDFVTQNHKTYPGSDPVGRYLPACQGAYYLHLGSGPRPPNVPAQQRGLAIHKLGLDRPLLEIANLELPGPDDPLLKHGFTFDKRFHLVPQAKLLIVIPSSNDRLILHRVDLEQALEKLTAGKR
jgi:Trypsin-like peptidase domain